MAVLKASAVEDLGSAILVALGTPSSSAQRVSRELVRSNLMGVESHGAIRILEYVEGIKSGRIRPGSTLSVVSESATTVVVDAGHDLGIVSAFALLDIVLPKAKGAGLAMGVTRRCNHVGRLASYVESAARQGLLCLAGASIPRVGHYVVPWGGAEGRLGTNPFAYAVPTTGDPIISDIATSVLPEGKVRTARAKGETLPEGAVIDASGTPTRDPNAFYGPPRGGLLPFGGPSGHKGYALGLLMELLGGILSGEDPRDELAAINSFWLLAIDPVSFLPSGRFEELADELVAYLHDTRPAPGHDRVTVPGERSFAALRDRGDEPTITIDDQTWARLVEVARELGIRPPHGEDAPAAQL